MTQPITSTSTLGDRAMLVSLTIRQWTASKHDKTASKEVSDNHGSDVTMGRYHKSLIAKDALESVKKQAGSARTDFYRRTLPWRDDGWRILSSLGYMECLDSMRNIKGEFDSHLSHFYTAYPRYVDDARGRLNGLWSADDYPSVDLIRKKFEFTLAFQPLPSATDFRVNLGDTETARIRRDIEEQTRGVLENAVKEVWTRLHDVTSRMSERLKAFNRTPDGKMEGVFRDSLVTNVSDLLDILPSLNITSDPQLASIADDMRRNLLSYSAEELREQDTARKRVADSADRIIAAMGDYV